MNDTELFLMDPSSSPISRVKGYAPAPMRIWFGDTETRWQRPLTVVDYVFWGAIALSVGSLALIVWNPPLRRRSR